MKRNVAVLVPGIIFAVLSSPLVAQWPRVPPPGVPKDAGGRVNLVAGAPRTPDAMPDLSGIWDVSPRREPPGEPPPGRPPLAVFADIGVNIVGGDRIQPWAPQQSKQRVSNQRYDHP